MFPKTVPRVDQDDRKERHLSIDGDTLAMLLRVCEKQDEVATARVDVGVWGSG